MTNYSSLPRIYIALTDRTLNPPNTSIIFKYFLIFFNAGFFLQSVPLKSSVKPSNAQTGPADDIFPPTSFSIERTEQFSKINCDPSFLSVDQEQVPRNQRYKFLIYMLVQIRRVKVKDYEKVKVIN